MEFSLSGFPCIRSTLSYLFSFAGENKKKKDFFLSYDLPEEGQFSQGYSSKIESWVITVIWTA